jgi:hypothetical protein
VPKAARRIPGLAPERDDFSTLLFGKRSKKLCSALTKLHGCLALDEQGFIMTGRDLDVKRVASAVDERSISIHLVRRALTEI